MATDQTAHKSNKIDNGREGKMEEKEEEEESSGGNVHGRGRSNGSRIGG